MIEYPLGTGMIELDYKLSSDWRSYEVDLRSADEMTLRYDAFPGDVVFRVGDADFSAQWGWVPVLDFALALDTIAGRLESHRHELFEFTESDATIDFRRNGDEIVSIGASYAQVAASVGLPSLAVAAERFLHKVCDELASEHPDLEDNEYFGELTA